MLGKLFRFMLAGIYIFMLTIPASSASTQPQPPNSLILLLPDATAASDPRITAWLDAAQEEGFKLKLMYDSEFLQLGANALQLGGIILPDQVHQIANDALVSALQIYVAAGGKLMLVYDAGALTASGLYATPKSRFSALVGVDYILYDELREFTVGLGPVSGMESKMWQLQVPPGKSMPFPDPLASTINVATQPLYLPSSPVDVGGLRGYDHNRYHKLKHENNHAERDKEKSSKAILGPKRKDGKYNLVPTTPTDEIQAVTGYVYGFLDYPSYVTRGTYAGITLLESPEFGLVAGLNSYGNGKVLFVNLPLSYLKGQTDGMLMHGFLKYFGSDLLQMPRLANHPNARGGLVLNWHVDSAAALEPMQQLAKQKVWDDGPYSIHFTAGPDTITFGDGLGLNVPGNPLTQKWIRYFDQKGHQVGSHGGWIHDYFGRNASETNQAEFEKYLVWNKQAIETVLGQPIIEYSATEGNNPKWATNWLEQNNFTGYYFTGHTGMGPTRSYREGQLMNPGMWAFPVTPYGKQATFEEFAENGIDATEATHWLTKLVDFSVQNRTSRLIYFHPPGATQYPGVVTALLDRARQYTKRKHDNEHDEDHDDEDEDDDGDGDGDEDDHNKKQEKRFEWYTMADLARFNAQRMQVSWQITDLANGKKRIKASHPVSLAKQTWILPKAAFSKPRINKGKANISGDSENWLVSVKSGTVLKFTTAPPSSRKD